MIPSEPRVLASGDWALEPDILVASHDKFPRARYHKSQS